MIRGSFVHELLLLGCFVFLPLIVIAVIITSVAFLLVDFLLLLKLDFSWWHLRVGLGCSCRESEFAGTAGSDEHLFNTRLRHLAAAATISAAVTVGGSEASTDDVTGTSFNGVF